MSRIFLSHSSTDWRDAVALKEWLESEGWDDVFLDLDPERGLVAGERWQEALRRAANRCEAVVFLLTPAWVQSKWCLAEFLLAKNLNKRIFGVLTQPVELERLPAELTAEWQLCHLCGEGERTRIQARHLEDTIEIAFLSEGLARLKRGLQQAGLTAEYFPWPPADDPKRSPYPGLRSLDVDDAAVFFGRDTELIRALDALRGLRVNQMEKLFVILGGSGSGKSSFMRAGLWPRLKRDDRHFYPLPIVRPETRVLSGERGLVATLMAARVELGVAPMNRGDVEQALLGNDGVTQLRTRLDELRAAASGRLIDAADQAGAPTIVLPIDQAEELFNPAGAEEATRFLLLLEGLLSGSEAMAGLVILLTIRSDRYAELQSAPALAEVRSHLFDDLKPLSASVYKEIIEGPARVSTAAGRKLVIESALTQRLIADSSGADALPLLAFILERLYTQYGADGDLLLKEYQAMGGIASIIEQTVSQVLVKAGGNRDAQLHCLKALFVPWLVSIDERSGAPLREVCPLERLPDSGRMLIEYMVDAGLLLRDQREGRTVVEIAHESLMRQWEALKGWLEEEARNLKIAEALDHDAWYWSQRAKSKDALRHTGSLLLEAETLLALPAYAEKLGGDVAAYVKACRDKEDALQAAEIKRLEREKAQAELATQRQRSLNKRVWSAAVLAGVLGVVAVVYGVIAQSERRQAEQLLGFLLGEKFLGEVRDTGDTGLLEQVDQHIRGSEVDSPLVRGLALRNRGELERSHGAGLLQAIKLFEQALQAIIQSPADHDQQRERELARTHERLGEALADQGKLTAALTHYESAIAQWRVVTGNTTAVTPNDCDQLADDMASVADLKNRMGVAAKVVQTHLTEATEMITGVLFASDTSQYHCGVKADHIDAHLDPRALGTLGHVVLARAVLLNAPDDYEGSSALAAEARELQSMSMPAMKDSLVAVAWRGNGRIATLSDALDDYRTSLSGFEQLTRRDPDNHLWQRERAAVQLLISQGMLRCVANTDCKSKYGYSLNDAEALVLEAESTLRALAKLDNVNASLQADLGWALQVRANILSKSNRETEWSAVMNEAERTLALTGFDSSDTQAIFKLSELLADKSDALAAFGHPSEAVEASQQAVTLLVMHAAPENSGYLGALMTTLRHDADIRRAHGNPQDADVATREGERIDTRYGQLTNSWHAQATKQYDSYSAHINQGATLFKKADYSAALTEFTAGSAAIRNYILLNPGAFAGYDGLRNTYAWIQHTMEKMNRSMESIAALNDQVHAAHIAALLARKDGQVEANVRLTEARRSLGIQLFDSQRYDEALMFVQQEIALAEVVVQQAGNNPDYLYRLGNAQCGLGKVRRGHGKIAGWEEALRSGLIHLQAAVDAAAGNDSRVSYLLEIASWRQFLGDGLKEDNRTNDAQAEYRLALDAYHRIQQLAPGNVDASNGIDDLKHLGVL